MDTGILAKNERDTGYFCEYLKGYLDQFKGYGDTMLSESWGYLPHLFLEYGIFFKIVKGIWDTWILLPGPHQYMCYYLVSGYFAHLKTESISICF